MRMLLVPRCLWRLVCTRVRRATGCVCLLVRVVAGAACVALLARRRTVHAQLRRGKHRRCHCVCAGLRCGTPRTADVFHIRAASVSGLCGCVNEPRGAQYGL